MKKARKAKMTEVLVFNTKEDGAEFFRSGETKETYAERKVFNTVGLASLYAIERAKGLSKEKTILLRSIDENESEENPTN